MRKMDDMQRPERTRSGLVLYLAFAGVIGLLWLERHLSLTPADHTIALLTIVMIFFVVTWMWLDGEGSKWR